MDIKAKKNILDDIEIASPCTASWDNMNGDAVARHCGQCQFSVYNISEMSKKEAEKLIQKHEGRLCIRLYRRFPQSMLPKVVESNSNFGIIRKERYSWF